METISSDPAIQARYEEMIRNGESSRFAEMIVLRGFPGINGTDKAWNRGRANGNQFEDCPALGEHYRRVADQAGVSTTGKYYVHGLGRFPGDPRAWCSDTSDALAIARERNLNLDGTVTHRAHDVDPTPDVPLAEDIWERGMQEVLAGNPDMSYEDAREAAFARIGPRPAASSLTDLDLSILAAGPPDVGGE